MRIFEIRRREGAMKRLFRMLKIGVFMLIISSLVTSLVGCRLLSDKQKSYNNEYEKKLSELVYEKQMLINEKNGLDSDMENKLGNASFMSLVFAELDDALYNVVYPMMSPDEEGAVELVGVMALSPDELPGMEGNVTLDEYNELISHGWGAALYWDGHGELADFVTDMQSLLSALDIDMPSSVIFAKGAYTSSYDEVLADCGIENAIHSGEEEMKFVEKNDPDGIWHPGRIGWRWVGESTRLKQTVEKNDGYALFEIGFDNSEDKSHTSFFALATAEETDQQRQEKFRNMLDSFRASIAAGKIEVCNIDDARSRYASYYDNKDTLEAEKAARLAEIESAINDVTRRMTELYNEYY